VTVFRSGGAAAEHLCRLAGGNGHHRIDEHGGQGRKGRDGLELPTDAAHDRRAVQNTDRDVGAETARNGVPIDACLELRIGASYGTDHGRGIGRAATDAGCDRQSLLEPDRTQREPWLSIREEPERRQHEVLPGNAAGEGARDARCQVRARLERHLVGDAARERDEALELVEAVRTAAQNAECQIDLGTAELDECPHAPALVTRYCACCGGSAL
jgi:hypothetical protein